MERAMSPLEAIWTARPPAEAREGLSLTRIVGAAIEVADTDGLGAVSMSRVAKSLGFTTMSLYRHVANKEELILHMQDAAVGPPPADLVTGQDWRADLGRWSWAAVRKLRDHPWILQTLSMFGPPATPNQLSWFEYGLRALGPTPLGENEKVSAILLIQAHSFADLTFHTAGSATAVADGDPYETLFTRIIDPKRFPALTAAFSGGGFASTDNPEADRDWLYEFGLQRILDGVQVLVEQRRSGES
ncbi:TetR/AcrR family transcriptional regulator [Micromonospora sp. RHAY321]|uniref:TetR/AcrR family transcriptional regulator n=1 Tax=Micromonospora sp. RHAY321 TaxID=2944807 RepID=UPI00207D5C93|nr:TetR/AcrR family transcriptional regulator [Micromonospora sp. RHAY321]MCO1595794.1 TetR/AcrR family transcriptional regulator [Micromonospora sp. RHAY321]